MSDEPENLTLVYLRRLDAKLDKVMDRLDEHGRGLNITQQVRKAFFFEKKKQKTFLSWL